MTHAITRRLIFAAVPIYLAAQRPAITQDAVVDPRMRSPKKSTRISPMAAAMMLRRNCIKR